MSNYRTACSFHQKWLNTHNTVHSNRLGISYNTQLTIRRKDYPKASDNTYVYTKKLFNYNIITSSPSHPYNPSTLKKQITCRKRLLRLLISQEDVPASAHRKSRRPQLLGPIELEEIFLSEEDLNSTWFGLPSSSHSSNLPYNIGSTSNETHITDSFPKPTLPVQRPSTTSTTLNPMYQRQLNLRAKKKAQKSQLQFSEESNRLYMSESYNDVKLPLAFIKTSSNLLMDWQNDFHCFMTGSPVPSRSTKTKKGRKKSKNRPTVDALTYDTIWHRFNELYRAHIARNSTKSPMFTAQSVKRVLPSTLDLQVNKRSRLLSERRQFTVYQGAQLLFLIISTTTGVIIEQVNYSDNSKYHKSGKTIKNLPITINAVLNGQWMVRTRT
ncbi:hypothetical protein C1645_815763 [Glomus cerebriforme]|uniref:DUF8211 domain-containing protein n=1 Tax=Glomus cerebriforme TaxID=658196 RepID=A0A397TFQ3_9GLOM|nr:hypothetical protein C1645_815763 [Glomus cerebriforme]